MQGDDGRVDLQEAPSAHVHKILIGLWQQREELGLLADDLLDLFRSYGIAVPPDGEGGGT